MKIKILWSLAIPLVSYLITVLIACFAVWSFTPLNIASWTEVSRLLFILWSLGLQPYVWIGEELL